MHLHILGICGTFMGGVAALAKAQGHRVTGCDRNVYPPMSDQLAELGIELIEGFDPGQLALAPDVFVIGNVVSRGNPLVEAILDAGARYQSGPQWLGDTLLRGQRVIAVAGTHGKTTTTSLVAHLLQSAGLEPGFLVGGVPANFGVSAQLGSGELFVIEADEYDTAFFDKRAKFVHYRPEIAVLNNLEFDHADIYADLAAIEWQFHQLLRTVPRKGRVIFNARDENLVRVLTRGCWTPTSSFDGDGGNDADVAVGVTASGSLRVQLGDEPFEADCPMPGRHNRHNVAAAIAACDAVGVPAAAIAEGLAGFRGVKRRLELVARADGIRVYDDFAHHPTAIRLTVEALLDEAPAGRLLVAFEPRSNTMKMGVHRAVLQSAFKGASRLFVYAPSTLDWDVAAAFGAPEPATAIYSDIDRLHADCIAELRAGDRLVMMSNGGFAGLREKVVQSIERRAR